MSTKRRKSRNNKINFGMPGMKNQTKQFKQIPSLNPTGNDLPVTNNHVVTKIARILVVLLIILIIIVLMISTA